MLTVGVMLRSRLVVGHVLRRATTAEAQRHDERGECYVDDIEYFLSHTFYILVEISISEQNLTYRFLRTERTTNQTCMQRVVNRP